MLDVHTLLPLASFAFVMSITPGPNNFMLLSSGARFGLRLSLAHLFGVAAGFAGLLLVCWFGVGALLLADPRVATALTVLCVAYLCWLGWLLLAELWRAPEAAAPVQSGALPKGQSAQTNALASARPMRWLEAFAFQFVNPKAWGMGVTAVSIVRDAPLSAPSRLVLLLVVCSAVNLPCVALWTLFGASMREQLRKLWVRRAFNTAMAACIVATALWMLRPLLMAGRG